MFPLAKVRALLWKNLPSANGSDSTGHQSDMNETVIAERGSCSFRL